MRLVFSSHAWEDYVYWQRHDRAKTKRINALIADIVRNGHQGIGNPEALRFDLAGFWSRRIDREHRLVYRIASDDDAVEVVACRYHYE